MRNNRFSNFKKESGLSLIAILATVAGAITMAIISSRLSSSGGSLLVTGLISAIAVVINGFYKAIFASVSDTAKKVIVVSDNKNDEVQEVIEENPPETPVSSEPYEGKKGTNSKLRQIWNFIKKNNFWLLLSLFITISLITIAITNAIDKSDIVIHTHETTEVTEIQKEELTDTDKNEIVNEILQNVDKNGADEQAIKDEISEEHNEKISSLKEDYTNLSSENKDNIDILKDRIDELEEQLSQYEEKIKDLESIVNEIINELESSDTLTQEERELIE